MKSLIFFCLFATVPLAQANTSWKEKAQMLGCKENFFGGHGPNEKKTAFDVHAKAQHPFNNKCTAPSEVDLKTPIVYKAEGSTSCKIVKLGNTPYGRWVKRQLKEVKNNPDAKGTVFLKPQGTPPSISGSYYCGLPLSARANLYDRFADKKACGEPELMNQNQAKDFADIKKHLQ